MLPSNPRAGLPSNPRSRVAGPSSASSSNDETRGRRNEPPRRDYRLQSPEFGVSVARARTETSRPRGLGLPGRTPSRPQTPSNTQNPTRARSHSRPPAPSRYQDLPEMDVSLPLPSRMAPSLSRRSDDSASYSSSSGSSIFDRRSERGGYVSSRTSFEDDDESKAAKSIPSFHSRAALYADSRSESGSQFPDDDGNSPPAAAQGHGYDIWSRVTNVATVLTVNVSKAWTANIVTFAGEETPPGGESRLTRAMKAYHASKAQSPSDLPDWLFTERERRVRVSPAAPQPTERYDDHAKVGIPVAEPAKRWDLYQSSAPLFSAQSIRTARNVDQNDRDLPTQPKAARGADRLKAMRDARRNASNAGSNFMSEVDMGVRYRDKTVPTGDGARARSAVGSLPSGPRRD